jgi:hypothetical protein
VGEQVFPHEPVVAVQAVRRHGEVLVEVERDDVPEAQAVFAMEPDQLAIDSDRGRAGGQSEHRGATGGAALRDELRDPLGDADGDGLIGLFDDDRDALVGLGHGGAE